MKNNFNLAIVLVIAISISTICLVFSLPINDLNVRRQKESFSLETGQIFSLFTSFTESINKIQITLTSGSTFNVSYKLSSDTPTVAINESFTYNHTFIFSNIVFFNVISPISHIEGLIEIDYGPATSIP